MHRRVDPAQVAKLVEVQHARRAIAEASLTTARDDEFEARAREARARDEATSAQDDWFSFVAGPGFAPDYARALAGRLVAREDMAAIAAADCDGARRAHLHCQDDWRLSEAQVKLTEASLDRARRDAGRDREERRLAQLSDRVTYAWVRS